MSVWSGELPPARCFDTTVQAIAPAADRGVAFWTKRVIAICVLLAAVGAGVFIWMRVTHTIRTAEPVPVPKRPPIRAVVWSERVFASDEKLASWLSARGKSYRFWAHAHPRAAKVLEKHPRRR